MDDRERDRQQVRGRTGDEMGHASRPPLRVAAGPIAVEAALLDEMTPWIEEIRGMPQRLTDSVPLDVPVRLVVPSRSLREHFSAAIVARFGAVVGVSVRTLTSLALEIGERSERIAPVHRDLGWILVRQFAREETALRDGFEGFIDGYGPVEAAVADLLDAGFEAHHAESVEEGILASGGAGPAVERACALVRVAARADEAFAKGPVGHRSQLFRAACECIELDSAAAPPSRALFLHGFSDATGVQSDLIEALVRVGGARVWLDQPPVVGARVGALAYGRRFRERLEGVAGGIEVEPIRPERPRVAVLYAPGPDAEARAVAVRIRALIDAGASAERIGVVARSLTAYCVPLRLHFHRLGIPFSALGERGPAGAAGRQLVGLQELLTQGSRTRAECWLDLQVLPGRSSHSAAAGERVVLRRVLNARGVARLADVACLELPDEDMAISAAANLCARLADWPEWDRLDAHRARLRQVVDEDLGWRRASSARSSPDPLDPRGLWDELDAALHAAGPGDFELTRADFLLLLERHLTPRLGSSLGGKGAGVQVLNVMEARARTFDHLFVVGLGRNLFPRTVSEDPLLPDETRRRLRAVLPELPVKAEGRDEEHFLFGQLVAASPAVTLTCPITDDDGKAQAVSPLVEGLVSDWNLPEPERAPWLFGSPGLRLVEPRAPRPAHEHAILAGLYGSRRHFQGILRMALDEARGAVEEGAADSTALARSRCAVLAELDPTGGRRRELGPYFGFAGERPESVPSITALEAVAGCPWQTFLGRVLRLDVPPDPLGALPRIEPRTLGTLVHSVLEHIAREVVVGSAGDLEAALKRGGARVDWPEPELLDRLIRRCAESAAREQGISLPGFARILALEARRRLAVAREHDWPASGAVPTVLDVELTGSVRVRDAEGRIRTLGFRADRVDRSDEGLCFTDYKTGKPGPMQKTRTARERGYRSRVEAGVLLQAAAYAHAGGRHGPARGRYLYLSPDVAPETRSFEVRSDDVEFTEAFEGAVRILLAAWDRGTFFPRLVDNRGVEPRRCAACEVKLACLRGDSGARRRLEEWTRRSEADRRDVPAEAAMRALWFLGKGPPPGKAS